MIMNQIELNKITNKSIKIKNGIKTIKYSNKKRQVYLKLIYQYYYDQFKKDDFDKAYIIIFFSDNFEIKLKAINSFLNVIKGIKLEENERFILIENEIFNNQLDVGIHIYYLKDYENKPLILIDCIVFGYNKDKEQDDNIMKAFSYLFQNLIKHINLVCFIIKESDEKLDLLNYYVIGLVTSLFSENILNNFIYLVTNIETYHIKQMPQISINLLNDLYYDYIKYKMGKKWFYSINSKSIFSKEINELSKYSYGQLNDLYKDKIQNSQKVLIKESLNIIKSRLDIESKIDYIITNFKTLKKENNKIHNFDSYIISYQDQIYYKENNINYKNREIDNINYYYLNTYNNELNYLEREHKNILDDLDNQYETITKREMDYSTYCEHTICTYCKKNCHEYCSCIGGLVNRCKVFPIFGNDCEECGHDKSWHKLHQKGYYTDKYEKKKIPNYDKISQENNRYYQKRSEINSKINNKNYEKEKIEREISYLTGEKNSLQSSKNYYINEKNKINSNMKQLNKDISNMISNLIDISNLIGKKALNKYQFEIDNKYIDYLIDEIEKKNNNKIKIEKLLKRKETNVVYQELSSNYCYLFGFKYGATH